MDHSPRTTRRGFLTAAAAAVAAPYVLRATALGAAGRKPPSDRITLGMIGMGTQGNGHLGGAHGGAWNAQRPGGFLAREDVHVLAVCDVDRGRRENAKKKVESVYAGKHGKGTYKGCAAYNDFRDLVTREDIDVVCIATPDHWHALISIWACRYGKDVYCEKPMTRFIREGPAMIEAARLHGRIIQAGTQQRSSPAFRRACELVRNGRIGKVQTVHVNVGGPSSHRIDSPQPVPPGLDWEMWLGPAPWRPYHPGPHPGGFRNYRDFSGGGMTDWGAHHYDIAQWALGMDETGPVEIDASKGQCVYKYANGVVMFHGGAGFGDITFTGTKGRVGTGRWYVKTEPPELLKEPLGPDDVHLYESNNHADNFLECVRTRRRPIADPAVIHRSVSVCHLGNIAYWLKRPLKWDPEKEEFVGDEEANRWVSRAMREPWRL